jgi:hypothetical protein
MGAPTLIQLYRVISILKSISIDENTTSVDICIFYAINKSSFFGENTMNALFAVLRFFGRLFRDIWLEIWRPVRKFIVRWGAVAVVVLALLLLIEQFPATFTALITLSVAALIMIGGFKLITKAVFHKRKIRR